MFNMREFGMQAKLMRMITIDGGSRRLYGGFERRGELSHPSQWTRTGSTNSHSVANPVGLGRDHQISLAHKKV
jgi:hypothetical protein